MLILTNDVCEGHGVVAINENELRRMDAHTDKLNHL